MGLKTKKKTRSKPKQGGWTRVWDVVLNDWVEGHVIEEGQGGKYIKLTKGDGRSTVVTLW